MKKIEIFTDGSHIKGTDQVGYGICFVVEGDKYYESGIIDSKRFADNYRDDAGKPVQVSNPTAELMALAKTMEHLRKSGLDHHLIIYSDYNGVQKWVSGEWKAKAQYIKDIVYYVHEYIAQYESMGGTVQLKWIKGHNGDEMNDWADGLAKNRKEFSNIRDYVTKYSKTAA